MYPEEPNNAFNFDPDDSCPDCTVDGTEPSDVSEAEDSRDITISIRNASGYVIRDVIAFFASLNVADGSIDIAPVDE